MQLKPEVGVGSGVGVGLMARAHLKIDGKLNSMILGTKEKNLPVKSN